MLCKLGYINYLPFDAETFQIISSLIKDAVPWLQSSQDRAERLSSASRRKCKCTCRCSSKVTLFQLFPLLTPNSGDLFNTKLSVFYVTTLVRLYTS